MPLIRDLPPKHPQPQGSVAVGHHSQSAFSFLLPTLESSSAAASPPSDLVPRSKVPVPSKVSRGGGGQLLNSKNMKHLHGQLKEKMPPTLPPSLGTFKVMTESDGENRPGKEHAGGQSVLEPLGA